MSSRIKLSDEQSAPLLDQPMPFDRSIRWVARNENRVDPHVHAFFAQSAYRKCVEHAASDLAHEVGGMLVGTACIDATQPRPYILIEDILPAMYTNSGQAHVTFTQDTLVYLHNELEARFPGKRMVGWYHTHPHFGVFLSSYDSWLHQNFFRDPSQVALVVDPCEQNGGIFCWQPGWKFDPIHYVGFYELSDVDEESIVEWSNLTPVIDESSLDSRMSQETKGVIS